MTSEEHDPIARFYDGVLRRVLWGDAQEDIMRTMEVNGISPTDANRLYRMAVSERTATIRSIYLRRIFIGLLSIAIGCCSLWLVYHLTEGFTVWSIHAILIPAAPVAFGAWNLLNGLVGVLTAASRTGSVADID